MIDQARAERWLAAMTGKCVCGHPLGYIPENCVMAKQIGYRPLICFGDGERQAGTCNRLYMPDDASAARLRADLEAHKTAIWDWNMYTIMSLGI